MGYIEGPKVSIIVPVYNAGKFIDKCISSIRNQSYLNIEIILINDGSTDNSFEICKRHADIDSRIKVLDKINGGVSSARNIGLEMATGDYIGFVDSDDYISPNMYEILIKAMIENEADIVECGFYTCNLENSNIEKHELSDSLLEGNYNCSYMYLKGENTKNYNWNKLFKKALFNDIRFPDYSYSEDYWVNAKLFYKCNKKVTLSTCLYYYVTNDQSAVNTKFNIYRRMDTIKAAIDIYDFYSSRFPSLCPYIAIYICRYVLLFYYELNHNTKDYKQHQKSLENIYNKYCQGLTKRLFKKIISRKTYVYMITFKINPKLYLLLRKTFENL